MINYFTALFFAAKSILVACPFDKTNCSECNNYKYQIKKIGQLPGEVEESSGLAVKDELFFTHPDSGNPPIFWGVKHPFEKNKQVNGKIEFSQEVENNDWEDLAQDDKDNIYIGDFGNNDHDRKDLSILKYNLISDKLETIYFSYPDQKEFPPKKNRDKNYDCEAMLWTKGNLYLFSKNKGNKNVKIYKLPDQPGRYEAVIIDTLRLPLQITGADISPDDQFVTLLSYGKVLLYQVAFDNSEELKLSPFHCKRFTRSGQSEAIVFLDEENLLITNEKGTAYCMFVKKNKITNEKRITELEYLFPMAPSMDLLEDK